MKIFEVGGSIRDELLAIDHADADYAVETTSFEDMKKSLLNMGFTIFTENPEFLTIRAKAPKGSRLGKKGVADFVLCRKDGTYSDGRRPDFVEPGTILDDLARRDFTVNAIARDIDTRQIIDPFDGRGDIELGVLRFVGDPTVRIKEDGLRVLRALRFSLTKRLKPDSVAELALASKVAIEMLGAVSIERIREELEKMFAFSTSRAVFLIGKQSREFRDAIFRNGLRLQPTLKQL